jgi:hypothetical protein
MDDNLPETEYLVNNILEGWGVGRCVRLCDRLGGGSEKGVDKKPNTGTIRPREADTS